MEKENHELLLPLVDEENICLPLPINVVSKYWNIDLPMAEALESAKKYSGFDGSILIEGIEIAERHGLACKIFHSSLSELKKIIDLGIPPIVILPGIPEITQHASVITGYDEVEKTILHYIQKGNQEGEQQEGAIPQDVFEKEWSEEGRLMIILVPSDILHSIDLKNDSNEKSNRLCLISEKQNILKNNAEALESLKQALDLDENNPTALNLFGAMLNAQNSPECIKYYEKCLQVNSNSYLSYNGLGNFYLKTGQFDKAENSYNKAIKINSKRSAKIYKNRAFLREKQNNNSGAKDDLKNYLKYFPKAPDRGIIEQAIREL
ncbi:MAG: tetratricopeptide repeat protein [Nitrosopumilus sp.]|uniref:tetratricopeptide repeat protein n=1 Tax=Nitrosopumilus sp. TaxID=2024843 RepID=UPI00247044D5|nr:tetratricopeptide repeat protein [Nitrosopumilus sp.]MDH5430817.1 tetratricopeptide repeat protein [Nitrosopumilus sp.]MDH5665088.1 tetratricopeptide repeat protein [Nitrosopumilus sp.]MDH5697213.1 tetratricopeptide repeat protein [Nitrosopumilus sp.]